MDDYAALAGQIESTGGDVMVFVQPQHTLVILYGDIDVRCTDELEHAGRFALDAACPAILDVRKVTLMDSVGLSFLIRLAAGLREAGAELVLRGPCQRVAELIMLVGADGLVRWTTTETEPKDLPRTVGG